MATQRKLKKSGADAERQRAIRFPVRLPIRYTLANDSGWGELIDISSSGALFTTERPLPLGKRVELCIDWPALLLEKVHLKLVARGRTVRIEPGRAAITIMTHEFRTSGSAFLRASAVASLQVQVANQAMQGIGM